MSSGPGGSVTILNSKFIGNVAAEFGGALAIGSGGGSATCSLTLEGVTASANNANRGGAQIYDGCNADLLVTNSTVYMNGNGSQVSC